MRVNCSRISDYPREQEAVNIMANMTLEGIGYSEIIYTLNKNGFRTKTGKYFGKNSIYEIIVNEPNNATTLSFVKSLLNTT